MQKDSPKNKIESIHNQILKLKEKKLKAQKDLKKSQHSKIISLIKKENGFSHDFTVLIGAFSEALKSLNALNKESEKIQTYHKIGEDILGKNKKRNIDQENQKNTKSQILKTEKSAKDAA